MGWSRRREDSGQRAAPTGASSGSDSNVTLAGISGVAGTASARAGDAETGLEPVFDKSRVQQDLAAQVAITQTFFKEALQELGDLAQKQMNEAMAYACALMGSWSHAATGCARRWGNDPDTFG